MAAFDKAQNWYEVKSRLDMRVAEGEAALTQAMAVDQAAEADRSVLTVALKAFSLRAELESEISTGRKLADAEKTLIDAVATEHKAIEDRDQAIAASNRAQVESDAARAAYTDIGQELDKAKELDAKIDTAMSDVANCEGFMAGKTSERDAAAHALAEVEAALESARVQYESDLHWLAAHQAVEALAVRTEDVAKDLSERLNLEHEMASAHQQAEHLDRAMNAAQTSLQGKETALATLQTQESELGRRIADFKLIFEAIDVPTVAARRDAIMSVQGALDGAQNAAE